MQLCRNMWVEQLFLLLFRCCCCYLSPFSSVSVWDHICVLQLSLTLSLSLSLYQNMSVAEICRLRLPRDRMTLCGLCVWSFAYAWEWRVDSFDSEYKCKKNTVNKRKQQTNKKSAIVGIIPSLRRCFKREKLHFIEICVWVKLFLKQYEYICISFCFLSVCDIRCISVLLLCS